MEAFREGHSSITKLFLDRGCKVNVVADSGYTALHYACNRGLTECVKELLAHGADTSIELNDGDPPLSCCRCPPRERDTSYQDIETANMSGQGPA